MLAEAGAEAAAPDEELEAVVCACIIDLVDTLKPEYAAAVRRVDLDGRTVRGYAEESGITPGNAGARLRDVCHPRVLRLSVPELERLTSVGVIVGALAMGRAGIEVKASKAIITRMSSACFPGTRRMVAALLLLCFAFFGLEAEVADVHDQDAAINQLAGHSLDTKDQLPPDPSGTNPFGDTHPFHVCHCSHTHAGVLPNQPHLIATTSPVVQLPWSGVALLLSIRLLPPLRPPIA